MLKIITITVLLLTSARVFAEQAQSTSQISIEVVQGCMLDNGSGGASFGTLDFGEHSNLDMHIDASGMAGTGAIGFRCSPGVSYRVELGNGLNANNSATRKLVNNSTGEAVQYQIYREASRNQVWDTSNPVVGTSSGEQEWLTIYGRIPAQQLTPSPGIYSDRLEVTLIF